MMRDAISDDIVRVCVCFFIKRSDAEGEIGLDTDERKVRSPLMLRRGHVQRKISTRYTGKKMRQCLYEWARAPALNIKCASVCA